MPSILTCSAVFSYFKDKNPKNWSLSKKFGRWTHLNSFEWALKRTKIILLLKSNGLNPLLQVSHLRWCKAEGVATINMIQTTRCKNWSMRACVRHTWWRTKRSWPLFSPIFFSFPFFFFFLLLLLLFTHFGESPEREYFTIITQL